MTGGIGSSELMGLQYDNRDEQARYQLEVEVFPEAARAALTEYGARWREPAVSVV